MDFRFGEDQLALRDLAREILEKELDPERLKELESGPETFDRRLWETLGQANLLGVAIPETYGGTGLGLIELCLLLQELGRAVAPVPGLATLLLGGLPLAELGSEAQRERWLPGVARGDVILGGQLLERGSRPDIQARRDGPDWVLEGPAPDVPFGHLAERVLVPAATDAGVELFLVDPAAAGATVVHSRTSSGEPLCGLELRGMRVPATERLDSRPGILEWLRDRALVAVCALQLGVCERALEITSRYVSEREQFGVPIGTFQAVQHRAADAYVDLECMRWTLWNAAWRLSEGLPAHREAAVAKFWASEGASRIAQSAQHLHAGIGVDRDYVIHRYFLRSKQLELQLGAATPQLLGLGRDMVRTGPEELA